MITFIILGIIQGAVLGLLAIGLVLVYKGTRVFNFAQGEFATAAGFFLFIFLTMFGGIKAANSPPSVFIYLPAIMLALIAVAALGFLVERLIVRPLFDAPRVTLLVATAGLSLLMLSVELLIGGTEVRQVPPIVGGTAFGLAGATVTWQQLITVFVLGGLALGLAYFFKRTDLGLAVLATSQESVATELVGIGTRRISSFVWTFAAVLGATAGILQAPDSTFEPFFMTRNFLLLAFTAAVVGGITSLAGAFAGGQVIGIVSQLATYFDRTYIHDHIDIPGLPNLIIFILLVTVLITRPKGLLGTEA